MRTDLDIAVFAIPFLISRRPVLRLLAAEHLPA
jgi:hypothetical protein